MTRVKLCGLRRECDIEAANAILPDYIGFVLDPPRWRYVDPKKAAALKAMLDPRIKAVGVFVDEDVKKVAELLNTDTIDIAQLHGYEDDAYIRTLKSMTTKPVIKAFKISTAEDTALANACSADYILLDSGQGSGKTFDWHLLRYITRDYFVAGGLGIDNVAEAVRKYEPFAVDVSSGIETDRLKDPEKMKKFTDEVRNAHKEKEND